MLAQGKGALIPAPPSSWDLGGSGPPGEDPWGAQMWGGKPTRHSPSLQRIHNTKNLLWVLLLLVVGDGPAGPWLNWSVCSVLLRDLGHFHSRGDTQNMWMSWHLKRSRESSLSSFIMAMLLVLPVTITLLHYFLISWDIYTEWGKWTLKWFPPFLLHLQELFICGPTVMENLMSFKKQWEKKPAGKVSHGGGCPSPQSRMAAGSAQLGPGRYMSYKHTCCENMELLTDLCWISKII